jgi:hypothetical protein
MSYSKELLDAPQATVAQGKTAVGPRLHGNGSAVTAPCSRDLSEPKLFVFITLSAALFVAAASAFGDWRSLVSNYGDNAAYAEVAKAIQSWDFKNLPVQHFMGYSYWIAATSFLLHVPLSFALCLVAWTASLTTVFLVARLLGTWTAAYFALSNFAWLQRSFLGGSEPLALALGLGAFWFFRRGSIFVAALLASLAVTVRPLMIFALVGIGGVLLYRKRFRAFVAALATSVAIGGLYMVPLAYYLGDPLLTVHTYTTRDYGAANVTGPHGHLFGWPFHGIVAGTMAYSSPWTNLLLSFFWILLVLLGIGAMFSRNFRKYFKAHTAEGIFCSLYLVPLFCYDYLVWARGSFMRFSIPVLPFLFYALLEWLPKDRRMLWLLSTVSPILAAFSAIGIRNLLNLH